MAQLQDRAWSTKSDALLSAMIGKEGFDILRKYCVGPPVETLEKDAVFASMCTFLDRLSHSIPTVTLQKAIQVQRLTSRK